MILKTARDLKNISTRLPTAPSSHKTAHIVILSILKSEIRKPKAEKTPTVYCKIFDSGAIKQAQIWMAGFIRLGRDHLSWARYVPLTPPASYFVEF